jgi:hypothetical protein
MDADPVCGAWVDTSCEALGLACKTPPAAAPRCDCKDAGPVFYVDAAGGGDSSHVATGAQLPALCRFRTLADGLARAGAWAATHASSTVQVSGSPPGTFTEVVDVPAKVELLAPPGARPADWVIRSDTAIAEALVTLHEGSALQGFELQNVLQTIGAASGTGIAATCRSPDTVSVGAVTIQTNALEVGIEVGDGCAASLQDVQVVGARMAGLHLSGTAPSVDVTGGSFSSKRQQSGEIAAGILVEGSASLHLHARDGVTFDPATGTFTGGDPLHVELSDGPGISADGNGTTGTLTLAIDRVRVRGNGGKGIDVRNLPAGSAVRIESSQIESNTPGPGPTARHVGGISISSSSPTPPVLQMHGTRVWRNDTGLATADALTEIALFLPRAPYDLSGGPQCPGPLNNVIGTCLGGDARLVDASDGNATPWGQAMMIDASGNSWLPTGGPVSVTSVNTAPVCVWVPPACN